MSLDQKKPQDGKFEKASGKVYLKELQNPPGQDTEAKPTADIEQEKMIKLLKEDPKEAAKTFVDILDRNQKLNTDNMWLRDFITLLYKQVIGLKLQYNLPLTPKEKEQISKIT